MNKRERKDILSDLILRISYIDRGSKYINVIYDIISYDEKYEINVSEIIDLYTANKDYKGFNTQEIINFNEIELKNFEINPNYFFPTIGQTNPKFDKDDYIVFINNSMTKLIYKEMMKLMIKKIGYNINDDYSIIKNINTYKYKSIILSDIKNNEKLEILYIMLSSIMCIDSDNEFSKIISDIIEKESVDNSNS